MPNANSGGVLDAINQEPTQAKQLVSIDQAVSVLAGMRKDKWESIAQAERADLEALKIVAGVVGAVTVGAEFAKLTPTARALVFYLLAIICAMGVVSMIRNYVLYLRALGFINILEDEMRTLGLRLKTQMFEFRPPKSLLQFSIKFLTTARCAHMATYMFAAGFFTGIASWILINQLNGASQVGASVLWLFAYSLLLVPLMLRIYVAWLGYERIDSAGIIVVRSRCEMSCREVLLLESGDGRLSLPKGHRRLWEKTKACALRELQEETGLEFRLRDLPAQAVATVLEPELPGGAAYKRLRLYALEVRSAVHVKKTDSAHRRHRWVQLTPEGLSGISNQVRGEFVMHALNNLHWHLQSSDCRHVVGIVDRPRNFKTPVEA